MIWANFLFSFTMSFLLKKVEDVTTISKPQSLTSVRIKHCTLRVPNKATTLFLLQAIIKAIFIQQSHSSHFLHSEPICAEKETQSSLFNSRPICTNPLFKFRLALSERHRSFVNFKVQRMTESPLCAMMLIRTKKMSRDLISRH